MSVDKLFLDHFAEQVVKKAKLQDEKLIEWYLLCKLKSKRVRCVKFVDDVIDMIYVTMTTIRLLVRVLIIILWVLNFVIWTTILIFICMSIYYKMNEYCLLEQQEMCFINESLLYMLGKDMFYYTNKQCGDSSFVVVSFALIRMLLWNVWKLIFT